MNSFGVQLHQLLLVHVAGLEPALIYHPREFKSLASTYFTIRAFFLASPVRLERTLQESKSWVLPLDDREIICFLIFLQFHAKQDLSSGCIFPLTQRVSYLRPNSLIGLVYLAGKQQPCRT